MDVYSKSSRMIDQNYYSSHQAEFSENKGWKHDSMSAQKTYLINGKQYKAIDKLERHLPTFSGERIKGVLLGVACTLASGGLALISKRVRNWISGRQVVRVCVEANSVKSEQPKPDIVTSSKVSSATNELLTPTVDKPKVPINLSSHQASSSLENLVSGAAKESAKLEEAPLTTATGSSSEISHTHPDETKARLIGFYVNQQARLMDLKSKLEKAPPPEKSRIQDAIDRIERSDMNNAKISLKVLIGKDPTPQELAGYLGKSAASVRGFYLGQAYSKAIMENIPEIVSAMKKEGGFDPEMMKRLSGISEPTLADVAKAFGVSHEKAADIILDFWSSAAEQVGTSASLRNLEAKIDGRVSAHLGVEIKEIKSWIGDIGKEKELGLALTRLGEERKGVYDTDFKKAAYQTFQKHQLGVSSGGMWTFFQKGDVPSSAIITQDDAKQQWKLFLNPKPEEFQATLDRALKALESMPYINGKIVASDDIKRKSDKTVLEDPCEPKLLFYFNGPTSAEDFKKAIQLLENEFKDADMAAHPTGMRDRGKGTLEPQRGPSFTKERNPLMFYVQGGFTESQRDKAISRGELDNQFEGENYYLHKGFEDPLKDIPGTTYSVGSFISEMKENAALFSQPFQLVKLQNMLNRLNQDSNPSPEVNQWKGEIRELMGIVSDNMGLERMSSMNQLLEHWESMGDVKSATARAFYKQLDENVAELAPEKGLVRAKVDHMGKRADAISTKLQELMNQPDLTSVSLQDILKEIPPSLQYVMIRKILAAQPELKEQLLDSVLNNLIATMKKHNIPFKESNIPKLKDIFSHGDIQIRDGQLVFVVKTLFFERKLGFEDFVDSEHLERLNELGLNGKSPQLDLNGNQFDARSLLQLGLDKLINVKERQVTRTEALNQGESVVLPQYYHATDASAAASIAKTGIEALQASSGFGAFFSTEPEFRYGAVVLGLPKEVEFKSQAGTVFNQVSAPNVIKNKQQVWAGLKKFITINPQMQVIQSDFATGVQKTVSSLPMPKELSPDAQFELKERLKHLFNRAVVFRSVSENGVHQGFSLNYRNLDFRLLPSGSINKIENEEALGRFADAMINTALRQMDIPEEKRSEIANGLRAPLLKQLRSTYLENKTVESGGFVLKGAAPTRIKASVIAPDDELRDLFLEEFTAKNKSGDDSKFKTLTEVKEEFAKQGFNEDQVEFIPMTEQLIERDLLSEVDAKVPKAWK